MGFLQVLWYEVLFYWAWWLCFAAIAFCASRWLGWIGIAIAFCVVSALIVGIEFHSVFQDMRRNPEGGRDADGPFLIGVVLRIVLYNLLMAPFGSLGIVLWVRKRNKSRKLRTA